MPVNGSFLDDAVRTELPQIGCDTLCGLALLVLRRSGFEMRSEIAASRDEAIAEQAAFGIIPVEGCRHVAIHRGKLVDQFLRV
jgi:hypothetical protein